MASEGYNGCKNWNQWNVSLWINNDEGLYCMAVDAVKACKGNIAVAARRWNACAGIEADKLWPGAMGEMVEALANLVAATGVDELCKLSCDVMHDDADIDLPNTVISGKLVRRLAAILAKLGKV